MADKYTVSDFQKGLQDGNIAILSKAITLIESTREADKVLATQLIDSILPMSGNSVRIGITGVPGVGKSTFIEAFGMHQIAQGKKVAVLAIDPSSSSSKGSILGDKTRMEKLSVQPNAFIRPSAASGSLGGVAYKSYESILLCEAAGFDTIIIETVGVGQSEIEVNNICDFFLLLMLAGAGDELQGIKRGIMEMADGIAITKADGTNEAKAKMARSEYARALHFFPATESGWIPEAKICSAYENQGIAEVAEMIERFVRHQQVNGYFSENRSQQNKLVFQKLVQEYLYTLLLKEVGLKEKIQQLSDAVATGNISPYSALQQLR